MTARRTDLIVGIVLGVVVGLAVVAIFVFVGSEGTIDSPGIKGVDTGKPAQVRTTEQGSSQKP